MTARLANCIGEQTATEASTNWSKSMSEAARLVRRTGWKERRRQGRIASIYTNDCSNKVWAKKLWGQNGMEMKMMLNKGSLD